MHATPVVFCCDTNYANAVAVTIASLVRNSSVDLSIHCIAKDLTSTQISAMMRAMHNTGSRLTVHPVENFLVDEWKTMGHFTTASYYRIMIPQILQTERALYLDGDIIVTCDVAPLLDMDMNGAWVAGCFDRWGGLATTLPKHLVDPYINTGVLLMDLKLLRANDFIGSCITAYNLFYEKLRFADQCIINACSKDKKLIIEDKWNFMVSAIQAEDAHLQPESMLESMIGRSIIHVVGAVKPWMYWCDECLIEIWQKYAQFAFDDVNLLIERPTSLEQYQKIYLAFAHQRRFQKASAVLDLLLAHYKKKASELTPACAEEDESLVIELEQNGNWRDVVLEKARLVKVIREGYLARQVQI